MDGPVVPDRREELRVLVEAAEAREPGAMERLRAFLGEHPVGAVVLERLVPDAREVWLRARAGESAIRREVSEREVRRLRMLLGDEGVTGLEQVLIERVIVCWLALDVAECQYVERTSERHAKGVEEYWGRRVDAAHRRFLSACKSLAQVRRLRLPVVVEVDQHA